MIVESHHLGRNAPLEEEALQRVIDPILKDEFESLLSLDPDFLNGDGRHLCLKNLEREHIVLKGD